MKTLFVTLLVVSGLSIHAITFDNQISINRDFKVIEEDFNKTKFSQSRSFSERAKESKKALEEAGKVSEYNDVEEMVKGEIVFLNRPQYIDQLKLKNKDKPSDLRFAFVYKNAAYTGVVKGERLQVDPHRNPNIEEAIVLVEIKGSDKKLAFSFSRPKNDPRITAYEVLPMFPTDTEALLKLDGYKNTVKPIKTEQISSKEVVSEVKAELSMMHDLAQVLVERSGAELKSKKTEFLKRLSDLKKRIDALPEKAV